MGIITFADSIEEVDVIPTGLFIDKLTGVGGIPRGGITEIFGDEGIGKTSLSLQVVAAAQQAGLRCLWVDVEWSYAPRYAADLGVDNSKLGLIREEIAENTLEAVEEAVASEEWDLVVLDSVGGILPRNEAEKSVDGKTIGSQAGLMAKFCRKIVPRIVTTNTALIVINHAFIDVMSGKLLTSGGKKLAYHKSLSIRLKLKQNSVLKQGDTKIGKVVIGEVRKNKYGSTEGMELEGHLIFGQAFSASADTLNDAIENGIIYKKGNTYFFGEEKLTVGLSKVRKMLEEDEGLLTRVKEKLNA